LQAEAFVFSQAAAEFLHAAIFFLAAAILYR
jgi:hypothetical protein